MVQFPLRHLTVLAFLIAAFAISAFAQTAESCTDGKIFSSKNCIGDTVSPEEKALFEIVNKYRVENGLPALKLSSSLSLVANRRMLDLNQNMRTITHSWSNCPYDIKDEKTWPCQTDSPKRLNSGYNGEGYETLYRTNDPKVDNTAALAAWQRSALHSSIILNRGIFENMPWDEFGVAISGSYASLWFGYSGATAKVHTSSGDSGVSYGQAISDIFKSLSIAERSATNESNGLRGFSADKKLKVEIWGQRKEISETNIAITVTVGADGTMDLIKKAGVSKLLKNMFPEWTDVDTWLDNSLNQIDSNRTAWRVKTMRTIKVEMKAADSNAIMVSIRPQVKNVPIEM